MRIRRAVPADAGEIWAIRTRAILHGCASHYPPGDLAAWAARATPATCADAIATRHVVVALGADGGLAGFAQLDPQEGTVEAVYVDPDRARRGVGRALLSALEDAAARLGLRVLICGGRSELELQYGERIAALMRQPCVNLVGKDTLLEFLATLQRATVLISPDSGPAHMATTVGTPVIGLYAATNPARSGPYYSRQWCVDRYEAAALKFMGKPAAELPWTEKIEQPGVMDLITPGDVIERLDALMAAGAPRTPTR